MNDDDILYCKLYIILTLISEFIWIVCAWILYSFNIVPSKVLIRNALIKNCDHVSRIQTHSWTVTIVSRIQTHGRTITILSRIQTNDWIHILVQFRCALDFFPPFLTLHLIPVFIKKKFHSAPLTVFHFVQKTVILSTLWYNLLRLPDYLKSCLLLS